MFLPSADTGQGCSEAFGGGLDSRTAHSPGDVSISEGCHEPGLACLGTGIVRILLVSIMIRIVPMLLL